MFLELSDSEQESVVISRDSVLFVTLDSCRYDTLQSAMAPNMKRVGAVHCAQAPSYYTYGSHSAMFVGFTPGIATVQREILNPKFGKLFKLARTGWPGRGSESYALEGSNIIEGFRKLRFSTIGSGAVGWFDPQTQTGQHLTGSFEEFFYCQDAVDQIGWTRGRLKNCLSTGQRNVFVFLNLGETHVPYHYRGAPWSSDDNPCIPFQKVDRSAECRERQRLCCEYLDGVLQPLLEMFDGSTILICGDHGDCWGEDGLWEHGISHFATLTVPLLVRVRGQPVN